MSLIAVVAVNASLATAVVAALACVCRIPYRLDRAARPNELWTETVVFFAYYEG